MPIDNLDLIAKNRNVIVLKNFQDYLAFFSNLKQRNVNVKVKFKIKRPSTDLDML
jgi:hypothetical protein